MSGDALGFFWAPDITETVPIAEDLLAADFDFVTFILSEQCEPDRRETLRDGWVADMASPVIDNVYRTQ